MPEKQYTYRIVVHITYLGASLFRNEIAPK